MDHRAFQLNKVRRAIRTQGRLFRFERPEKNKFGEPTDGTVSQELMGLFHELTGYKSTTSGEAATIRKKSSPMVLMMWEDAQEVTLDYRVFFNGKEYSIGEIKDLGEANLIVDISLEEVQTDGSGISVGC